MQYRFKTYQGKFKPQNPQKYVGDVSKIVFRSMWELQLLRWCDFNADVLKYASEEIVIPYRSVDGQMHRYFVDMMIWFSNGQKLLIEVKPKRQTRMPKTQGRKNKARLVEEILEFEKNKAKWAAADEFAKRRGLVFKVWTEDTLKGMGILLDG